MKKLWLYPTIPDSTPSALTASVAQSAAAAVIISFFIFPTFSEPCPIEFVFPLDLAQPCSVPRLTHFRARSHEVLKRPTRTRESTIPPKTTALYTISVSLCKGVKGKF